MFLDYRLGIFLTEGVAGVQAIKKGKGGAITLPDIKNSSSLFALSELQIVNGQGN